jgi:hypothetical protein
MTGCSFPTLTQTDVAALAALETRELRKDALRRLFASADELPTMAFVLWNADDEQGCVVQHAAERALIRAAWPLYQKRKGSLPLGHMSGRHVPNRARHMPRTLLNNLIMFADAYWRETLSQGQTHLMMSARERSFCAMRRISSSLRPRRVTSNGLVIVRGQR